MADGGRESRRSTAFTDQICGGECNQSGEAPNRAGRLPRKDRQLTSRLVHQEPLGLLVAAMVSTIDQRPESPRSLAALRLRTDKAGTDAEQHPAPLTERRRLLLGPWKWRKERQPGVFQLRKLEAAHCSRQQFIGDRLQPRLARSGNTFVQLLEPFTPPSEANCAEPRVAARRHHVGKCQIEVPQRRNRGPDAAGQLLERDLAVVIEPALSDSRRPSPPRRPATP